MIEIGRQNRRRSTTWRRIGRRRSCRASCASRCASGWGPAGRRPARRGVGRARRSRAREAATVARRSRSACSSRSCTPSTSGGSARRFGARCPLSRLAVVELLPEFREYERCSTTVANAYLAPRARRRTWQTIEPRPLVMQSSGGVVRRRKPRPRRAAACVRPDRLRVSPGRRLVAGGPTTCSRLTWAEPAPT